MNSTSVPINDIHDRIQDFKRDLICHDPLDIVRRHIVFGDCAAISSEKYFLLRRTVATNFNIHPNNVLIVGSGKLGFSIAPQKRYRPFGDSSDLDVVIVSDFLFNLIWRDIRRFMSQGGYWESKSDFVNYFFRGWIRPDKLPPDQNFKFTRSWWDFFQQLSAASNFSSARVTGAIYQSWHFLEEYQTIAIRGCAQELNGEEGDNDEN